MVETKMMPIKTEEDGDDADADGMVKVDISDTNGPDKESLYLLKDQKKSSSGEEVNTRPNENKMKILIISAVLGNILEWYDFGVFASFSSELSRAFFTGGRLVEMLKVYGVFAAAFFARPLGGFVLGLIGDKFARTISLQISVVAMGFSALFIACLPTNSVGAYKIGPAATVLLVSARIVQGLSTGGEMVGSMLYMVENVPETSKCLVSAIPMASAIAGTGTGYLVAAIITAITTEEQRVLWGWRVAFALGVPAGLVGFMFRSCLCESHSFSEASKSFAKMHGNQHPYFYASRKCFRQLFVILFLCMLVCGFYSGTVWYNEAWLEEFYTELVGEERKLSKLQGRTINTIMLWTSQAGGTLLAALYVDRNPQRSLHSYIIYSCAALVFISPVALWLTSFGRECVPCVVAGQFLSISFFTFTVATLAFWLTTEFPSTLQYTSIALSYNFGQAFFGGTVPFIATQISSQSPDILAPSYYLSAMALMGALAMLVGRLGCVRKMHQKLNFVMTH